MEEFLKKTIKEIETFEFYCKICLMEMHVDQRERVGICEAIKESSGVKDKSEREVIHEFVKRLKVGISNSEMAVSEMGEGQRKECQSARTEGRQGK